MMGWRMMIIEIMFNVIPYSLPTDRRQIYAFNQ